MKSFKYIILSIVILYSSSCKKNFLDVPDKTELLREAYVTDLKTLGDYLNGIYVTFSRSTVKGHTQVYPELIADNIQNTTGVYMNAHFTWTQKSNGQQPNEIGNLDENLNGLWLSAYHVIRSSSFLIENVDKYRSENPARADDYTGQAYAFRAFAHFLLVNSFAQSFNFTANASHPGIPYITTSDLSEPVSRQTVSEVYAGIIADLNKAIQLLPAGSIDTRFMNRLAAKALLARVLLFKGDFAGAKNLAREVGTTIPIMISANYPSKLFSLQETEALFQLVPVATGVSLPGLSGPYTGTYATNFQGRFFRNPLLRFNATTDIANILRENPTDSRRIWVTQSGTTWTINKYPVSLVPGFTGNAVNGAYYETVFRSSEMYLTAAECYANLSNADSARYYLNQIRTRANISAVSPSVTGAALLDSIYKERRRELCFEGLRMFDLLRWKKGVNRLFPLNSAAQSLPYPSNNAIAPIPLLDVTISKLSQNPGY